MFRSSSRWLVKHGRVPLSAPLSGTSKKREIVTARSDKREKHVFHQFSQSGLRDQVKHGSALSDHEDYEGRSPLDAKHTLKHLLAYRPVFYLFSLFDAVLEESSHTQPDLAVDHQTTIVIQ